MHVVVEDLPVGLVVVVKAALDIVAAVAKDPLRRLVVDIAVVVRTAL